MKKVFADSQYFVALINDKDQSHSAALAMSRALQGVVLSTTEEALNEVLAFFAERVSQWRPYWPCTVRHTFSAPLAHLHI
jgi:hypothetical protein